MVLSTGARLGPYEVLGALGAGGMGEVYRARDTRIDREVALKVLPSSYAADAGSSAALRARGARGGALSHPNLLVLFDVGTHEGSPYLVSELLEGDTLRERPGPGAVARPQGRGLRGADRQGPRRGARAGDRPPRPEAREHLRDPRRAGEDPRLRPGRGARPTEGAGESVETATSPTEPGALLGTLGYMSPEQVRGQAADHRADIFAFGAVLYEMLSGRRAFSGESPADTLAAILHKDPPELAATEVEAPAALDRILKRCLEKAPAERFQSARDLAFALESLSGSGLSLRGIAAAEPARPPARRAVLLAGGLLGLVALALAAAYLGRHAAPTPGGGADLSAADLPPGRPSRSAVRPRRERLLQRALEWRRRRRVLHPTRQPRGAHDGPGRREAPLGLLLGRARPGARGEQRRGGHPRAPVLPRGGAA